MSSFAFTTKIHRLRGILVDNDSNDGPPGNAKAATAPYEDLAERIRMLPNYGSKVKYYE
jgi:hypothetical protein